MSEIPSATSSADRVFFAATVAPHRSMPPRALTWIMLGLAAFGFCSGIGFVLAGAWPVTGFFGLDIALLYLAFRLSYRSARQRESLRLTEATLDVERVSAYGERKSWRLEPSWLRVAVDEDAGGRGHLLVASRGVSLRLAAFVGSDERQRLAAGLRAALQRWREALRGPSSD